VHSIDEHVNTKAMKHGQQLISSTETIPKKYVPTSSHCLPMSTFTETFKNLYQ